MTRAPRIIRTLRLLALLVVVVSCSAQLSPASTSSPSPTPTVTPAESSTTAPTASLVDEPTDEPSTPTPAPTPIAPTAKGTVTVPILYMHRVVPIPDDIATWSADRRKYFLTYMITPCEFAAQLDWLAAHDYTTILPRDLADYWDHRRPLPANPVILTFDDGSADWARTVLPLLTAHGFVAEFYLTVNHIGSEVSWSDVRALATAGMGIGAHDMDHYQLTGGVPRASIEEMRYQVGQAKLRLESKLGVTVDSMAYVGGGFDSTLAGIVREVGYRSARAIIRGVVQSPSHRYSLRVSRIGVRDDAVGRTLANAMACVLDPAMSTFESRLTGADPG